MKNFRYIIIPVFSLIFIYCLNIRIGGLPPIGKILDPFHGYLALIGSDDIRTLQTQFVKLNKSVKVIFDELRIPHIFAENEHDLYFVQGYIMAFDRLWQMEFQTHAAAGRLSEIVGEKALLYDRFQRRIGMRYGAEKSQEAIYADEEISALMNAFTEGINAYISSLPSDQNPLEYKILDYIPEPWTAIKTSLLLKYMAWTLTGENTELAYTRMMNELGQDIVEELFPIMPWFIDPIIPRGNNIQFKPIKLDQPQNIYEAYANKNNTVIGLEENIPILDRAIGSNNWAVSGKRTASGSPILSNDPHLGLNLPSIWYAMHLISPSQNVMGVTIPGAPGIIGGFNDYISWGFTNGYDDVIDWYDIRFRDEKQNEYYHNNTWKLTQKIVEEIKIRGRESVYDTVTYTHHGPVVWDFPEQTLALGEKGVHNSIRQTSAGRAMRWLAHEKSNEMRSFYLLNKGKNYDDFVHALEFFTCPGQNIVYADVDGNIAIWHAGNSPAKWQRQGMYIGDGTDARYDWQAFIPHDQKVHILNPKQGYIGSANQHPLSTKYPYFTSEFYWASFRWYQIHKRLDTLQNATVRDMMDIQMDNRSVFAEKILPILLRILNNNLLNDMEKKAHQILSNWNCEMDGNKSAPTIFRHWYNCLRVFTWEDDLGRKDERFIWPFRDKMMELILTNPESHWFDDKRTSKIETFSEISIQAFHKTVEDLIDNYGKKIKEDWIWSDYQGTDIHHLANIPGMGVYRLPTSGGIDIPNATGKTFGPSWRYVIEMGTEKKAYGIYPGGQSGFPGSRWYDNMIDDWVRGETYSLSFSNNADDIHGTVLLLEVKK